MVRRDFAQIPPHVEYSLSEVGEKIRPVLDELRDWGVEYISHMGEHRPVA